MKKTTLLILPGLLAATLAFTACQNKTVMIDPDNDTEIVAGLSYRDLDKAATTLINSLLQSGRFKRADGSIYVMAISNVEDQTGMQIDTDLLTAKISQALTNSGQVFTTSAISTPGRSEEFINATRGLRGDDEFDQTTIAGKGQLRSPDLALAGKIIARELRRDNRGRQYEYTFQMRITDLKTGLQWWQDSEFVGKRTDR